MDFQVCFDKKLIYGDYLVISGKSETQFETLFLHGAGLANRERFKPIRQYLLNSFNISSIAFDYLGHGDSSGITSHDSLEYRVQQAKEVISQYKLKNFSIVASSMSAYIALKLSEIYEISSLIIIVPAIYNRKAYKADFDLGFSEIIRRKSSWINTDAWGILENYKGNLLIVSAENDEIIPPEIITYIYDAAINARVKKHVKIPDCNHQILNYINTHPNYIERISSQIAQLIKE